MSDYVPNNVVVNYLRRKFNHKRFLDNFEEDEDEDSLNSRFFGILCRVRGERKDQNASIWADMLNDGRVADSNSNVGQLFRRRFRVPYRIFTYILQIIEQEGWHNQAAFDRAGLQTSRLDLKVLGWLRVLGRGNLHNNI